MFDILLCPLQYRSGMACWIPFSYWLNCTTWTNTPTLLLPYPSCLPCTAAPRALRWLPQASLIKHAFEALCINEFKGLTFETDENGGGMKTGASCCSLPRAP